jgi:hypothetical protein
MKMSFKILKIFQQTIASIFFPSIIDSTLVRVTDNIRSCDHTPVVSFGRHFGPANTKTITDKLKFNLKIIFMRHLPDVHELLPN